MRFLVSNSHYGKRQSDGMKEAMDVGVQVDCEGEEFGEVGKPTLGSGGHREEMRDLRQAQALG
jgi:hypothetical protein